MDGNQSWRRPLHFVRELSLSGYDRHYKKTSIEQLFVPAPHINLKILEIIVCARTLNATIVTQYRRAKRAVDDHYLFRQ
jgi:hypothetical protein